MMREYALVLFHDGDARVYYSEDMQDEDIKDVATNIVRGRDKNVLIGMAKLVRAEEWIHDPVDLCKSYRKMREVNMRRVNDG